LNDADQVREREHLALETQVNALVQHQVTTGLNAWVALHQG
jgi:hypothetical protein